MVSAPRILLASCVEVRQPDIESYKVSASIFMFIVSTQIYSLHFFVAIVAKWIHGVSGKNLFKINDLYIYIYIYIVISDFSKIFVRKICHKFDGLVAFPFENFLTH